jgi:hypothetical protein
LGGFAFEINTNDEEASAEWVLGTDNTTGATEPATYATYETGATITEVSSYGSYLDIKVTSTKGNVLYYRIRITMKNWAVIYYGTPTLDNSTVPAAGSFNTTGTIDSIWDKEEWLDVSRFNTSETYAAFFPTYPHTTARVKALWDDDGIWTYWDVDFMDFTENSTEVTRSATLSGSARGTGGSVPDGAH